MIPQVDAWVRQQLDIAFKRSDLSNPANGTADIYDEIIAALGFDQARPADRSMYSGAIYAGWDNLGDADGEFERVIILPFPPHRVHSGTMTDGEPPQIYETPCAQCGRRQPIEFCTCERAQAWRAAQRLPPELSS